MKEVLLITDVDFWLKNSGNRVRISSLISYLHNHVILTIVFTGPFHQANDIIPMIPADVEFYILEKEKYLSSTGYGRKIKKLLKGRIFNAVIIEYIHSSYFLNYLAFSPNTKLILDAHDIISERTKDFKRYNYKETIYELSAQRESEIMSVYDHILVLCKEDYHKVNLMTGINNALLSPHPVSIVRHPFNPQAKSISFVASSYLPNQDGINHFLTHCWPSINTKYDVHLNIYGSICNLLNVSAFKNVFLKGFAPDINLIYETSDIVINPVRFGAGVKIKNIEALAHGRPLVTTTHGARGLTGSTSNAFIIAGTPDKMINALSLLIENKERRYELSNQAHLYIGKTLTVTKCYLHLLKVINGSNN